MTVHYGNCTAISNVFIDEKLPNLSMVAVLLYLILERHPDLISGFHKERPLYNAIIMKTGMCRASVDKAWKDLKACGMFPVHNPEAAPVAPCTTAKPVTQAAGIRKLAQKPRKTTRRIKKAS